MKKMKYKFWSVYCQPLVRSELGWYCIPPHQKYIPKDYPKGAIVKKHEGVLPPEGYWHSPEYEQIVYKNNLQEIPKQLVNGQWIDAVEVPYYPNFIEKVKCIFGFHSYHYDKNGEWRCYRCNYFKPIF